MKKAGGRGPFRECGESTDIGEKDRQVALFGVQRSILPVIFNDLVGPLWKVLLQPSGIIQTLQVKSQASLNGNRPIWLLDEIIRTCLETLVQTVISAAVR